MNLFYNLPKNILLLSFILGGVLISGQKYEDEANRICDYINGKSSNNKDIEKLIIEKSLSDNLDSSEMNVHNHLLQKSLYKNCSHFKKFNWSLQKNSYLLDIHQVLNTKERKDIHNMLQFISYQFEIDVYIVTINDFVDQPDINQFSYTFLQQNDFKKPNGNMIIIYDKETKNIRISTNYIANNIITNNKVQEIINYKMIPSLKNQQYANAFKESILEIQKIISLYYKSKMT